MARRKRKIILEDTERKKKYQHFLFKSVIIIDLNIS